MRRSTTFAAGLFAGALLAVALQVSADVRNGGGYDQSFVNYISSVGLASGTVGFTENDMGTVGATETVDWGVSNKAALTMDENLTLTFTAPSYPTNLTLKLTQDAAATNTVAWPGTVFWAGGTAPTVTATANAVDVVTFYWDGTNYHGSFVQDMQ